MSQKEKEERLTDYLTSDVIARLIVSQCVYGKSTIDLVNHVKRDFNLQLEDSRSRVSLRVKYLEQQDGLKYEGTTWKTTDLTKSILKKYFGL